MYDALAEQYMLQEMHNRKADALAVRAARDAQGGDRRWWRRGTRRAR
jgi:hypothetical protein